MVCAKCGRPNHIGAVVDILEMRSGNRVLRTYYGICDYCREDLIQSMKK